MTQTNAAVDWMWCYEHPREAAAEIERLRAALQEITGLCKREPANPFLADKMDRVAIAALTSGEREYDPKMNPCDDAEFGMKP